MILFWQACKVCISITKYNVSTDFETLFYHEGIGDFCPEGPLKSTKNNDLQMNLPCWMHPCCCSRPLLPSANQRVLHCGVMKLIVALLARTKLSFGIQDSQQTLGCVFTLMRRNKITILKVK